MPENITVIPRNPKLCGLARMHHDVVFSKEHNLRMTLLTPWNIEEKLPLVVFIQGSAWTFPDIYAELPQLSWYARHGYVVATVTHRNTLEGNPFPAFLQDVKTAVRFARAHSEEYGIDAARVCAFGTSSGGNTALLLGMTGDDPEYRTHEYADQSDSVQLVVECFGPTDMPDMLKNVDFSDEEQSRLSRALAGGDPREHMDKVIAMSPLLICQRGKAYPPMLLLHGDADPVVPYAQGAAMYDKLLSTGYDARMVRVPGAEHEGSFWSDALHEHILAYIKEKL